MAASTIKCSFHGGLKPEGVLNICRVFSSGAGGILAWVTADIAALEFGSRHLIMALFKCQ
ncbi:hypothetical protein [Klebsiella pneumoniae]|uniref:hypothetical protein n=1 Tax=Klebsiella pneumoniae TaxID=573 RepID=UPI0022B60D74|nr:hypothetical protein [Klebsiella pneumoniae]